MNRNKILRATTWLTCALMLAAPLSRAHADATTEKLIQILVQNGVLRKDQAAALLAQAQQEAAGVTSEKPANAAAPKIKPNTVRVVYIPETVRRQIAAEVKQQVMQQAIEEGWAEPNVVPEWTSRVHISGDIRGRGVGVLNDPGNYNAFPDFNAINSSSNGYDASGNGGLPPFLNTTKNHYGMQLRARLDIGADVSDWITTDFRLATGGDRSPVTDNQTLGATSNDGDAGMFQKYSIWLDRANILLHPSPKLAVYLGREPDVFDVSKLMYDSEVNFDGIALKSVDKFNDRLGMWLNGGAFSLFNTGLNYGEPVLNKPNQSNAYLFALQAGPEYRWNDVNDAKIGLGYFDYVNVQGNISSLCTAPTGYGSCDTDSSRAGYVQFGNTLMPIRTIAITTSSSTATAQPQFYGLASRFQILDLHGRYSYSGYTQGDLVFEGEFAKNLGFNRDQMENRVLANNFANTEGGYSGGDTAYMASILWGTPSPTKKWQYNVSLAYKYLETDSVLDALTDSNFHSGGTNAKGFTLGGSVNVGSNTIFTTTLYSAKQVTGAPYANDVIMSDLMTSF